MMKNEKIVNNFMKELKKQYAKDDGYRFPDKNKKCELYDDFKDDIDEVLAGESPVGISFDILNALSDWHLDNSVYQILHIKNSENAKREFTLSSMYAYVAIKKGDRSWGCLPSDEHELMDLVCMYMAQALICSWWSEADEFAKMMIESINYGQVADKDGNPLERIIGCGEYDVYASWFILDLYCKVHKLEYTQENAWYPDNMTPYDEVIATWDTTDLSEVDRLTYNLSDIHLAHTKEGTSPNDYYEFDTPLRWIFPYEIISWLRLREHQGLENPSEFSHPLMNTPIAKMFLELKEPLEKPKHLPYADVLIAKLKEKCPKIDEEIEKQEPISILKEKTIPLKSLAPKTGRYRASLPNKHPQAKQLEGDPHSYARFKKDDTFTYEGLEDYDLSEIIWSYLGN